MSPELVSDKKKALNSNLSDESRSFSERLDELRSLVAENLRYTKTIRGDAAQPAATAQQELQRLLKENLQISKELYAMTKNIKRWVAMQRVWTVVKILIILVPVILGVLYLPSLIKQTVEPYQALLNVGANSQQLPGSLIQQLQDQINGPSQ